jgi:hypothetical protein
MLTAPAFPYHLVHRPDTLEGLMNGTTAPVPQEFALAVALPQAHPLFNDGPGRHHDLHAPMEALRRGALFVAHRYFRVPEERPVVFSTSEVRIAPVEAWRRGTAEAGPSHLDLELVVTPTDVVNGVPRGLECRAEVSVDGVAAGTAEARLVFLMPKVYQNHRARGRMLSREGAPVQEPPLAAEGRLQPAAVGRSDAANVVIGRCQEGPDDRLVVRVAPEPDHPVYAEGAPDHVPSVVLLEASRQLAFLHASRLQGFTPANCVLTRWSADFRGFAEPDLPLTCSSTGGRLERDGHGRPVCVLELTFFQGARQVGVIEAEVLEDC